MSADITHQLDDELGEERVRLGASSCTLYWRERKFPGEFRLVSMSGVKVQEPMFGFNYIDDVIKILTEGKDEVFVSQLRRSSSVIPKIIADQIDGNKLALFGDFREREKIKSFARLVKRDKDGKEQAIFFVNYTERTKFDPPLKKAIRSSFARLIKDTKKVETELAKWDTDWRAEATRIVSPIQTIAQINFYTFENPELFFKQVIENALKVLDIPEGNGLGVIHLYNAETGMLELSASYGPITYPRRARRLSVDRGNGVIAWAAITRKGLVIPDIKESAFRKIHVWINPNSKSELVVPLEAGGELIGTLCLESTQLKGFKRHHTRSVWYAANKAALAYQTHQLASMNRKLLDLCWKATKGDAAVSLNDVATLAKVYLKAESCDIYQCQDEGGFHPRGSTDERNIPTVRPKGWTDYIRRNKAPVWIAEIGGISKYTIKFWDGENWRDEPPGRLPKTLSTRSVRRGVRYALGLPITVGDACVGVAWVRYLRPRLEAPKPALMSLALGFAATAGLVLELVARREVDLKERKEIQSVAEAIAREITDRWQLKDNPIIDAHVESRPFHSILGGDFWAGKRIDERTVSILLADFQGHGVAGALYMLPLISTFESAHDSYSAAHVLGQLGKAAKPLGIRGTAIYAIFMLVDNKKWLVTSSAGHESLIVFRRNASIMRQPGQAFQNAMIGYPKFEPPLEDRMELESGDIVLGFTDGVADEISSHSFNRNRIISIVNDLLSKGVTKSEDIAKTIMDKARRHHGFEDDATLFVASVR